MKGPPQDVKWAPEGASASHNFPAKTAIAAPTVTFTTLSASVSYVWLQAFIFGVLFRYVLLAHAAMGKKKMITPSMFVSNFFNSATLLT